MSISTYYNNFIEFRDRYNSLLNTWANHLIVIFAFFIPISLGGRQSTLFLIMLVYLLRGKYWEYIKEALKDKLVQAFVIYFAVHLIWLIGTDNFIHAKRELHQAKFLLYPLLFATLIDKRYIPRMLGAFLLGMLVSELWSYGIYFEILPPHPHDGNQGTPQSPSPVHHHSHYGFMLAITVTLLLQRLFYEKDPSWLKAVIVLFFVTATINIFINAGRTGYVLFVVLMLVLFLLAFKKRLFIALLSAVALIGVSVMLAYNFSDTFHERYTQTINSIKSVYVDNNYNTSLGNRAAILFDSKDLIKENALFGVGTGDQMDQMRNYIKDNKPEHKWIANMVQHLHNEYFRAILQFGIIGLMAFLYIIYQLFVYPQPQRSMKNLQIFLGVMIILYSFVDIMVLGLGGFLTLVTLVALSLNNHVVTNANFKKMSIQQGGLYASLVLIIEPLSWIS
ncbi:O-antigen ligase family protein [Kaarinaea lacus]